MTSQRDSRHIRVHAKSLYQLAENKDDGASSGAFQRTTSKCKLAISGFKLEFENQVEGQSYLVAGGVPLERLKAGQRLIIANFWPDQ
jgi:hypothetical protein